MRWLILACLLVPIGATSCSGHDGCKGTSISDSSLTCNGGERCCKDMTFTCTGASCTVTITGGGHDQFRGSTVFAMDAVWFTLKCTASGSRDCKSAKIYCPMAGTCTCKTCPSSATMYCPDGVTCIGGGATVELRFDEYGEVQFNGNYLKDENDELYWSPPWGCSFDLRFYCHDPDCRRKFKDARSLRTHIWCPGNKYREGHDQSH